MRLTTKGRYAITAMLDLALNEGRGPVSLSDIAKRQNISLSYLEQLFAKLKKQGLVTSYRGPGGGYKLSREAEDLYIAEIVDAVHGAEHDELAADGIGRDGREADRLWARLSEKIHSFLSGISLASLVDSNEEAVAPKVEHLTTSAQAS